MATKGNESFFHNKLNLALAVENIFVEEEAIASNPYDTEFSLTPTFKLFQDELFRAGESAPEHVQELLINMFIAMKKLFVSAGICLSEYGTSTLVNEESDAAMTQVIEQACQQINQIAALTVMNFDDDTNHAYKNMLSISMPMSITQKLKQ